jgi:hypothetical protein
VVPVGIDDPISLGMALMRADAPPQLLQAC